MRARNAVLHYGSFLQVALHIAYGLNHVHSENYTHGDMKPQNVLLTSAFEFHEQGSGILATIADSAKVKIADFGLSRRLDAGSSANPDKGASMSATSTFGPGPCGTYLYMAPEAYRGGAYLDDDAAKASDVYSYALILFELLSGMQSWHMERVKCEFQLFNLVNEGKRPSWGPQYQEIDHRYIDLVESCWSQESAQRPTVDHILKTLILLEREYEQSLTFVPSSPSSVSQSPNTSQHIPHVQARPVQSPQSPNPTQHPEHHSPSHLPNQPHQDNQTQPSNPPQGPRSASPRNAHQHSSPTPPQPPHPALQPQPPTPQHPGRGIMCVSPEQEAAALTHVASARLLTHSERESVLGSAVVGRDDRLGSDHSVDAEMVSPGRAGRNGGIPSRYPRILGPNGDSRSPRNVHNSADLNIPESIAVKSIDCRPDPNQGRNDSNENGRGHSNLNGRVDDSEEEEHELDRSKIGDVVIHKVESQPIPSRPGPTLPDLDLPRDVERQPASRKTNEVIASFLNAGNGPEDSNRQAANGVTAGPVANVNYAGDEGGGGAAMEGIGLDLAAMEGIGLDLAAINREQPSRPAAMMERAFGRQQASPLENQNGRNSQTASPPVSYVAGRLANIPLPPASRHIGYGNAAANLDADEFREMVETNGNDVIVSPPGIRLQLLAPKPPLQAPQRAAVVPSKGAGAGPNGIAVANNLATPHQYAPGAGHYGGDNIGGAAVTGGIERHWRTSSTSMTAPMVNGRVPDSPEFTLQCALHQYQQHSHTQQGDEALKDALWQIWQQGHHRAVANIAKSDKIYGEELLHFFCTLLSRYNRGCRDSVVTKDLCSAIGHVVRRNSSSSFMMSEEVIVLALDMALLSMYQFPHEVNVYVSSTYAVSNLLRVNNVVKNPELRRNIAIYIIHGLSWNIMSDGNGQRDGRGDGRVPQSALLAYTGTCAARNFMWQNEVNATTFMTQRSQGQGRQGLSTTSVLTQTLRCFLSFGQVLVVESSLSALAMLIQFPNHRLQFVQEQGVNMIATLLQYHSTNMKMTAVGFSMLAVLFSGHVSIEEVELASKSFCNGNCGNFVVQALKLVQQKVARQSTVRQGLLSRGGGGGGDGPDAGSGGRPEQEEEGVLLEILHYGYRAVLGGIRYSVAVMGSFAGANVASVVVGSLSDVVRDSRTWQGAGHRGDDAAMEMRKRLGVLLCAIVKEFCRDNHLLRCMREANVERLLLDLRDVHAGSDALVESCSSALTVLIC